MRVCVGCLIHARRCGPVCPFAGRKHASNRLYLLYNHRKTTVELKCFDADCKGRQEADPYVLQYTPACHNAATADSLHDCEDCVLWSDTYDSPCMKPYPVGKGVYAIKGGMGLGTSYDRQTRSCDAA